MRARIARASAGPLAAAFIAAAGALAPTPAHALFDDNEARRAIIDLRGRLEVQGRDLAKRLDDLTARVERLEEVSRGQLELQNQIETLRQEIAKLRGQIEVQTNELAQTQRQQRELFASIDSRVKRFEPVQVQIDGSAFNVDVEERKQYDAALGQFRGGEFAASIAAFQQMRLRWPDSPYTPNAMFWQGSAQFALKDYKSAINTHTALLARFPEYPRAADALLNIGYAQAETGDKKTARRTLESIGEKYPGTQAAQFARERLPSLR